MAHTDTPVHTHLCLCLLVDNIFKLTLIPSKATNCTRPCRSLRLTGGQGYQPRGVTALPDNPVHGRNPVPPCSCYRNGDKGSIPLSSSLPSSIFQSREAGTTLANSITSSRLTEFGPLPIFHSGGRNYLFYPGKVKAAICLMSPTFKAL